MKRSLMDDTAVALLKRGYVVKTLTRACFDIVARRENVVMLVKVLQDANAVTQEYADAMRGLGGYLAATPLIVAGSAGDRLEDGVVYARFGVYVLSVATFANALDNRLPFVCSTHAGLTAAVDGKRLKAAREEQGFSLGMLSKRIGVSRQMILRYERGSDVTLRKAALLRELFGKDVLEKIDVLRVQESPKAPSRSSIVSKYGSLGFEAAEARKAPFDVVAKREKHIIFTGLGDKAHPQLESMTRLIDANKLVIFHRKKPKQMPALTKKEFMDFESAEELVKFIKEFE